MPKPIENRQRTRRHRDTTGAVMFTNPDGPATNAQRAELEKFGVAPSNNLTIQTAHFLIDSLIARRKRNLSTPRQVALLLENGYPVERTLAMTYNEASRLIREPVIDEVRESDANVCI
jgi:hypothetical protein